MDFGSRFIGKFIGLIVILIVGLAMYLITTLIKKFRLDKWEEFEEKVEDFNERNVGEIKPETQEFLEEHINDSMKAHVNWLLKHEENYRKEVEKETEDSQKD